MTLDVAAEADRHLRETPLTVAINAQIDPERAGGVETALNGLVAHLAAQATDERFLLLSTAKFQPTLRAAGRPASRRSSPGRTPRRRMPPSALTPRWQRWQARPDRSPLGVDAVHGVGGRPAASPPAGPTRARPTPSSRRTGPRWCTSPTRAASRTNVPFLFEPWDLQHRHHPEFFDPGRVAHGATRCTARAVSGRHWS